MTEHRSASPNFCPKTGSSQLTDQFRLKLIKFLVGLISLWSHFMPISDILNTVQVV